jgi:hypothetical protein
MLSLKSSVLGTGCLCFALTLPSALLGQDMPSKPGALPATTKIHPSAQALIAEAAPRSTAETASLDELPDSPGAERLKQEGEAQQQPSAPSIQSADSSVEAKPQRPVGTAAAEAPKVTGITAAEPAGVAIAPAKQKRVRTIVLKVGAIIGAGVALGTVVALSAGTSSKPPGAH